MKFLHGAGEERIRSSFPPNRGLWSMPWIDDNIVTEREDLLPNITDKALIIASREIGPSDGAGKKGVSHKYHLVSYQ